VKAEEFCDGCGSKGAIHVANRCRDKLHRVSAERHSRHDRRYPAPLRPVSYACPSLFDAFGKQGGRPDSQPETISFIPSGIIRWKRRERQQFAGTG
jgi:hypothetical protein